MSTRPPFLGQAGSRQSPGHWQGRGQGLQSEWAICGGVERESNSPGVWEHGGLCLGPAGASRENLDVDIGRRPSEWAGHAKLSILSRGLHKGHHKAKVTRSQMDHVLGSMAGTDQWDGRKPIPLIPSNAENDRNGLPPAVSDQHPLLSMLHIELILRGMGNRIPSLSIADGCIWG